MNREQLGIIIVAGLAVVTLSVATPTYAGIVEKPPANAGAGSAVFSEDVQLADSPNPQDRDLSGSPFLEVLYDTLNPSGEGEDISDEPGASGGGTSLLPVALAVGALVCVGIVATIAWFWRLRRSEGGGGSPFETRSDETETGVDRPDRETLARLDIDDLTNDVYRSWYELMEDVDLQRRDASTPRELARRAVEDGLDRSAVTELTELFEAVRYGTASPTPELERRARQALTQLDGEEEVT